MEELKHKEMKKSKIVLLITFLCVNSIIFSQKNLKPNTIFKGVYTTTYEHVDLGNGMTVWEEIDAFNITKLYRGDLDINYIKINQNYFIDDHKRIPLKEGQEYKIYLKLNDDRFKELNMKHTNPLYQDHYSKVKDFEIIKIVPNF